jgi:hypothetical protein
MEAQQVYDIIVSHLRTQGHKCLLDKPITRSGMEITCAYRSSNGDKCAAGSLILDSDYKIGMEGIGWYDVVRWLSNASELREHSMLIVDLQSTHDSHEVQHWEAHFIRIANERKLTYTPPQATP